MPKLPVSDYSFAKSEDTLVESLAQMLAFKLAYLSLYQCCQGQQDIQTCCDAKLAAVRTDDVS